MSLSQIQIPRSAALILITFLAFGLLYSVTSPPLEAGDESRHYAVIKYMADTGRLPIQDQTIVGEAIIHWEHEGNQPPLYYALAAILTAGIETGDWATVFWYNPHTTIGNPLRPDNKNITLHHPDESWPGHGHVLAIHLIRLFSLTLALVTVTASYFIALTLFQGNQWLASGVMALTAFNPMFIFISASVNNDNLVIALVSLALWLMIQLIAQDKSTISLTQIALLGLLIGLGGLSKLYALGLLPLAFGVLAWLTYREMTSYAVLTQWRGWHKFLVRSLTLGSVAFLVAGWFYLRNAWLYDGDFLGLQSMRHTAGTRTEPLSLTTLRAEFEGLRIAYWGLFGGVNILVAAWIYRLLDLFSLIAGGGLLAYIGRLIQAHLHQTTPPPTAIHQPTFWLLLGWCLIMVAGFIVWNLTQPATQGRLFYPAITAISSLTILGLTWWLPVNLSVRHIEIKPRRWLIGLISSSLLLFALTTPWLYIAPAYAKPPRLTEADLPPDLQPVDFTYDDTLRLIGYHLPVDTIRPAEQLPLTLYWQLLKPTDLNYSIFIHLVTPHREKVAQMDTYPGNGHWPTTLLQPGDIVADHYQIPIPLTAEFDHAPTKLLILAGIYDYHEPGRPGRPAINAAGQPVDPLIAHLKLIPWQWPTVEPMAQPINFFDKLTLLQHELITHTATLTLTWRVEQPLSTDYTVFIQAWDTPLNDQVAGFDGPPRQGNYPTSLWSAGEIIVDAHPLDFSQLPCGGYDFLIGLYDPMTGERLPAFQNELLLPNHAVNVGSIHLTCD